MARRVPLEAFLGYHARSCWSCATQAYEYIFPLGHGWVYDYGAGLETIPVHVALVNQQALGASLAPFVAAGVDRLSFFGNADSPLILSTWLFAFLSPPVANGIHMMLQSFVGSMFAGLLCHDRLKLGMPISAVAVVTYVSFLLSGVWVPIQCSIDSILCLVANGATNSIVANTPISWSCRYLFSLA